jgi:hypothetical protein
VEKEKRTVRRRPAERRFLIGLGKSVGLIVDSAYLQDLGWEKGHEVKLSVEDGSLKIVRVE